MTEPQNGIMVNETMEVIDTDKITTLDEFVSLVNDFRDKLMKDGIDTTKIEMRFTDFSHQDSGTSLISCCIVQLKNT